jgi:redox-sensitive bicupin YhaK (pirin superfamily)
VIGRSQKVISLLSKSGNSFKSEFLEESKVILLNGKPIGAHMTDCGDVVKNTCQVLIDAKRFLRKG